MWVATTLAALGFLLIAVITQFYGYRLGGTITVPILTVYTLKNVVMLPVFVGSTLLAFLGLGYLKRRTLIYGRDELTAAVIIGILIPVAIAVGVFGRGGSLLETRTAVFVGSILPGLAAYNLHQLKPEYRRPDLLGTVGLFAGLLGLGWLLVTPATANAFGTLTPPILFSSTADIAVYKNAVAVVEPEAVIVPRVMAVGLLTGGLFLAEALRSWFDVRLGVITATLLAIFVFVNVWFFALYLFVFLVAGVLMEIINRVTLRYGRVLLGVGTAIALVATLPVTLALPIEQGLTAFFTAIMAGVSAYNAHATAPRESRLILPLQLAVFVPTLAALRLITDPGPQGFPQTLTVPLMLGGLVVMVGSLLYARRVTIQQPSEADVLSGSVLSEGDGT
ncbi:poly-gamma-glutamate biosynthesis protein PgsC/CapC [Halorubrum sp. PV6]|uniref:poly-gamma-glutamate biosynthesis protein PgsC/CapC n=1 Tax=Halorubrum sp. PV6 TaxID=634157 RepID=UPI000F85B6A1|nr:poly-gamma-glutamate biosynthesis protein PgsC/CapC [Halorubrum sp. PV6]AZQ15110.1 hypothetical protein DOS48_09890 [Halorubrum sp. PV6]